MSDAPGIDAAEILDGIRLWVEQESHTADVDGVNVMMSLAEEAYSLAGAKVERIRGRDGYGDHIVARSPWGGEEPGILVLSHLDTVHPKGTLANQPFKVEGDIAYGPGIYDMKGGAYLGFYAFRQLTRTGRQTPLPITHLFVSDEEVGSPTSQGLIESLGRQAKYVLVTEPAREGGKIVTARKGSARFVVTATGQPAHSGARHSDGRSAIKEMARQILALEELTDYERGVTVNVGLVSGGTGVNVVPASCVAEVDVRLPTPPIAEEMIDRIQALTAFDPDVTIEVSGGLNRPPYEKSSEIASLFDHAHELAAEIGFGLQDLKTGGGSDGNFTAALAPTLDGLGVDGKGGHTHYEQLYISSLEPRAALMLRLFETLR